MYRITSINLIPQASITSLGILEMPLTSHQKLIKLSDLSSSHTSRLHHVYLSPYDRKTYKIMHILNHLPKRYYKSM